MRSAPQVRDVAAPRGHDEDDEEPGQHATRDLGAAVQFRLGPQQLDHEVRAEAEEHRGADGARLAGREPGRVDGHQVGDQHRHGGEDEDAAERGPGARLHGLAHGERAGDARLGLGRSGNGDRRLDLAAPPGDVAAQALAERGLGHPAELAPGAHAADLDADEVGGRGLGVHDLDVADEVAHGLGDLPDRHVLVADEVVDAVGGAGRERLRRTPSARSST